MNRPSFYDPTRIGTFFLPDLARARAEGMQAGLPPASKKKGGVCIGAIDWNIDFMDDGALPVRGAHKGVRHFCDDLIEGAAEIDELLIVLDQHPAYSIHDPLWWVGAQGEHPDPRANGVVDFVTFADVAAKKWRPRFLTDWSYQYARRVGVIPVWNPHCRAGTIGAAMEPVLSEVVEWLCVARGITPRLLFKGMVPDTDWFGAFAAVVRVPGKSQTHLNKTLLDAIDRHKKVRWGGLARDYCVRHSLEQMAGYLGAKGGKRALAKHELVLDWTAAIHQDETVELHAAKMEEQRRFEDDLRSRGVVIVPPRRR